MKTIELKLYNYAELSSNAKAVVFEKWQSNQYEYGIEHCIQDIQKSLEGLLDCLGYRLTDYCYGAHCQNWKVKADTGSDGDLSGRRGIAIILRSIMRAGYTRPKRFADMTFPGVCGVTGMCYDEDLIESLWSDVQSGETIDKGIDNLAYRIGQILEKELEYQTSRECFDEWIQGDGAEYLEDGEEY